DTGVSGKAASRVASMLRSIAGSRQVLCVTHLPQIACAAQHQYRISKSTVGARTQTKVEKLDRAGRIEDLCRLIGGEHITQATAASAEQMLMQAENEYKD
ncbi:MAG: DNA repair protein RecN, partial [Clostridia bacterium]|nr:DNA repair protein RecN [Clostridia bacterium]